MSQMGLSTISSSIPSGGVSPHNSDGIRSSASSTSVTTQSQNSVNGKNVFFR